MYRSKHNNQRTLWQFLIGFGIESIPGSLIYTLLTLRLAEQGMDATWIGIFATIPSLTYMVSLFVMPAMLRRFGEQATFRAAVVASALTAIGFLVIDSFALWVVLTAISGWAASVRFTIAESWIPALTPADQRGRAMAWFQTLVGASFFIGTGLLLITGIYGWMPLAVVVLTALAGSAMLWPIPAPQASAEVLQQPQGSSAVGTSLRLAGLVVLTAALLGGLFESGITTAVPLYGLDLGFDATMATWLVTAIGLGSLAQYPFGALADRFAWKYVVIGTTIMIALSSLLLQFVPSMPWLLWVLGFVWGSAGGGLYTLATIRNGLHLQGQQLTSASTMTQLAYMIGSAVGPTISGLALDLAPSYGLATIVAVLGVLGLVVIVVGSLPVVRPANAAEPLLLGDQELNA
jgi:MFS family permease